MFVNGSAITINRVKITFMRNLSYSEQYSYEKHIHMHFKRIGYTIRCFSRELIEIYFDPCYRGLMQLKGISVKQDQ